MAVVALSVRTPLIRSEFWPTNKLGVVVIIIMYLLLIVMLILVVRNLLWLTNLLIAGRGSVESGP